MTNLEASDTVPHETNQVEAYLVVDVETTSTSPTSGRILTIGAVAVIYDGNIATIDDTFLYRRLDQYDYCTDTGWYETIVDAASTLSWWVKQPIEAQMEAWRDTRLPRTRELHAAVDVVDWVDAIRGQWGVATKPVFTANPATFDKPWIDQLLENNHVDNPFDYRTLCLRSMAFGAKNSHRWTNHVRTNKSLVPHHAFFDAYAQAQDLVDLLGDRDDAGYNDKLYWLNDPQLETHTQRCNAIKGRSVYGCQ